MNQPNNITKFDYFAARETLADFDDPTVNFPGNLWKEIDLAVNGPVPEGHSWATHPIEMFRRDAVTRASMKFMRAVAMVQASNATTQVSQPQPTP